MTCLFENKFHPFLFETDSTSLSCDISSNVASPQSGPLFARLACRAWRIMSSAASSSLSLSTALPLPLVRGGGGPKGVGAWAVAVRSWSRRCESSLRVSSLPLSTLAGESLR